MIRLMIVVECLLAESTGYFIMKMRHVMYVRMWVQRVKIQKPEFRRIESVNFPTSG